MKKIKVSTAALIGATLTAALGAWFLIIGATWMAMAFYALMVMFMCLAVAARRQER
jgi:hypothetical protein